MKIVLAFIFAISILPNAALAQSETQVDCPGRFDNVKVTRVDNAKVNIPVNISDVWLFKESSPPFDG